MGGTHTSLFIVDFLPLSDAPGVFEPTLSCVLSAWDYTISGVTPAYIPWVYISEPCRANRSKKTQVDRVPQCISTSQRPALIA